MASREGVREKVWTCLRGKRPFFWVREERGFRAPPKQAPKMGASRGYQRGDGHETLRLLLLPPRSLCASTGHYPHRPSREPVQPATARVP